MALTDKGKIKLGDGNGDGGAGRAVFYREIRVLFINHGPLSAKI